MKNLLIVGDSSFAEIAFLYFSRDETHSIVGFVVEDAYFTKKELCGIPVYRATEIKDIFNTSNTYFYVAIVYSQMNRLRTRLYNFMKNLGYKPASYISEFAYIDPSVQIGEHVFIFEDNTLQPFVKIMDNVVLWSGNHIGHHSIVQSNVFISSHVVISGHCTIGQNSFLGVNSSIGNDVFLGADNWVLPGTNLLSNTERNQMWRPEKPVLSSKKPVEDDEHK